MKSRKLVKKIFLIAIYIVVILALSACGKVSTADVEEVEKINMSISDELNIYTNEVANLASHMEKVYSLNEIERDKLIEKVDKTKYKLSDSGVFYKTDANDESAVFVSGYIPINEEIKDIVYLTESIDSTFKTIVEKHPVIAQIYYNDENSYNRIYPSFDVLTQYEPKMNIPEFNFYYLADIEHNVDKKAVWVKEPYVDPAGRGWMISTIAPVYEEDIMRGVAGIDLTIHDITEKYLQDEDLFMITSDGTVVTISEKISTLLSLPLLKNHRYIETIKSDSYMIDEFNLLKSSNEDVRKLAENIVSSDDKVIITKINDVEYRVTKSNVENIDWIVLKMLRNR